MNACSFRLNKKIFTPSTTTSFKKERVWLQWCFFSEEDDNHKLKWMMILFIDSENVSPCLVSWTCDISRRACGCVTIYNTILLWGEFVMEAPAVLVQRLSVLRWWVHHRWFRSERRCTFKVRERSRNIIRPHELEWVVCCVYVLFTFEHVAIQRWRRE